MSVKGLARVGPRTKDLIRRLGPREIAIIAHPDLDPVAAASLAAVPVVAVINTCPSVTGRYPNHGPEELLRRGIPLLDCPGQGLLERVHDGDAIEIVGDEVVRGNEVLAAGTLVTTGFVAKVGAGSHPDRQPFFERFVLNTVDHVHKELDSFLKDLPVPNLMTPLKDRPAVVVARGDGYLDDFKALRPYIRAARPTVMTVDGAADALLELGVRPHVILGDMDSVSDRALAGGAELVVHAYPDGRAPGLARVRRLGLGAAVFSAPGTSEDAGLLLAYEAGARPIVAVGTHSNPVDFLDKGRPGMASTFLVRLKVGPVLVDTRGLSRLRPSDGGLPAGYLAGVIAAGLVPLVVVTALSPSARSVLHVLSSHLRMVLGF
ncbi:MAG TPA: putative cytokinetic ring protein SteA [Bacillota bacterium]|jgi:uncharacterized membrane-anchored protein